MLLHIFLLLQKYPFTQHTIQSLFPSFNKTKQTPRYSKGNGYTYQGSNSVKNVSASLVSWGKLTRKPVLKGYQTGSHKKLTPLYKIVKNLPNVSLSLKSSYRLQSESKLNKTLYGKRFDIFQHPWSPKQEVKSKRKSRKLCPKICSKEMCLG